MDIPQIASQITTFLAPALPYLATVGGKAIEEVGTRLGSGAWDSAKALWDRLRPGIDADPAAREAAEDLAGASDDPDLQAAFRVRLRKLLESDAGLAEDLERILAQLGPSAAYYAEVRGDGTIAQGKGARAVGKGAVVIGGGVGGDVNISNKD
jgi:hypothetical protein